jgi:hypothetical protein
MHSDVLRALVENPECETREEKVLWFRGFLFFLVFV